MSLSNTRVKVLLSCNHTLEFEVENAPKYKDNLWCYRCNNRAMVAMVKGSWVTRCLDCNYRRYFGHAPLIAKTKASKHMAFKVHTVETYQVGDYHETRQLHVPQQPVFTVDGLPPF